MLHVDLDGNYRNINKPKKPRAGELKKRMREIDILRGISIIHYPMCRKNDRDMTFYPSLGEWYCTPCYNENRNNYMKQFVKMDKKKQNYQI